ncbi:MAG: DNA repair protein RecO [Cocleimonas sp.]|nr:DNA repair protein RecO [Cocleimonas sp.]
MSESFGYILRNRPFRENSCLLEVFTQAQGRLPCIAHPAKKRGKILAGDLEPFRYLHLQWGGHGEVVTLIQAEECGRHAIPTKELLKGLYLNELIVRLTPQYLPLPKLFHAYKHTLHRITDHETNPQALMRFELFLLQQLGHALNLYCDDDKGEAVLSGVLYCYIPDQGISKHHTALHQDDGFILSGALLIALRDLAQMQTEHWQELRRFLDRIMAYLSGKPFHSRKLLYP